jgi:hypothetical protein
MVLDALQALQSLSAVRSVDAVSAALLYALGPLSLLVQKTLQVESVAKAFHSNGSTSSSDNILLVFGQNAYKQAMQFTQRRTTTSSCEELLVTLVDTLKQSSDEVLEGVGGSAAVLALLYTAILCTSTTLRDSLQDSDPSLALLVDELKHSNIEYRAHYSNSGQLSRVREEMEQSRATSVQRLRSGLSDVLQVLKTAVNSYKDKKK